MRCSICGKKEGMEFRCSRCEGMFCSDHRLPENHNCCFQFSSYARPNPKERDDTPNLEERIYKSIFSNADDGGVKMGLFGRLTSIVKNMNK